MKYAIYGINRVAKDFIYIFEDLDIIYLLDDGCNTDRIWGIKVKKINELSEIKKEIDKIIICDFYKNKNVKKEQLERFGLSYGDDFLFEEDLFKDLDENYFEINGKKIVIWGTGQRAEILYNWANETKVDLTRVTYIDTYKAGQEFKGYKILSPSDIHFDNTFFIVAVARDQDIIELLENNNLKWGKDFCTSAEFMSRPSLMLKQTIFDTKCYDFKCHTMLNHAEIIGGGNMICCCSTYITNALGRVSDGDSVRTMWHSMQHKIMCLSNENRTYSFCRKNMCPFFIGKKDDCQYDLITDYQRMTKSPTTVAVGHDETCNLFCITCRDDICVEKGKKLEKKIGLSDAINKEVLPGCEFLIMAGDGEVFLSKAYERIYTSDAMKNIKNLRFLTNGMLFNERKWNEIRKFTDAKIMMTVSIDAATKESYESIRRGGNFDVLQKNMEYAAQLRKKGDLSYLRFNFVVQKINYKEMPQFVKWGIDLGIDEVFFTKILNWGTYTAEEFKEISMMEEDGITPKPELEEVLNNPIMDESIVDLGTIRFNHCPVNIEEVDNYYRWELKRKVGKLFD